MHNSCTCFKIKKYGLHLVFDVKMWYLVKGWSVFNSLRSNGIISTFCVPLGLLLFLIKDKQLIDSISNTDCPFWWSSITTLKLS